MIEKEIVKNNLEWDHCYGVCTADGAAAMEDERQSQPAGGVELSLPCTPRDARRIEFSEGGC